MARHEGKELGPVNAPGPQGKVRVLIVEDSATQAESLRYTLEQKGYEVHVAGNGREALRRIGGVRPAAVITDIIMPEMDGFRLCREIKADRGLQNIPVILLTALSEPEDVLKGLECGADNFITKPYDREYLLAKLHYVLTNTGMRGEPERSTGKIEVRFKGDRYLIGSERRQMLDLLLSSYETAVAKNRELKQAQEKLETLNEQLERNVEDLREQHAIQKAINRIFHETLTCETPEQLGAVCLAVLEELTSSEFGFIGEIGPDGLLHDIAISDPGWDRCRMTDQTGHRKPPGHFPIRGIYGRVLLGGKSVLTNDPSSHPDRRGIPPGHPVLKAFLGVPLLVDNKVIGMVGLGNRGGGYTAEQQRAVETVTPALIQALLRKQAEKAMKQSEARFRLLSGTAGRLLATDDPQGIVNELCRKVMEHLDCHVFFNFLADEAAGRLHLNACGGIPEEEATKIEWLDFGVAVCGCVARDGVGIVAEDIFATPDPRTDLVKSYGIHAYACNPMMIEGKLIGTLSFGTRTRPRFSPLDLDLMKTVADQVAIAMERKRLIEELRGSKDELEERVRDRTAELERRNRELQNFTFAASHDLQEPLRKIQTFGDLLLVKHGHSLDRNGSDFLRRMCKAAAGMQGSLRSLLQYSTLTSNNRPPAPVDLNQVAGNVISGLEAQVRKTNASVVVENLPVIEADESQMTDLVANLLVNALKFRRECESPRVRVHSRSKVGTESKTDQYEIYVEDNGIGFDEQYLEKIFVPFQRLHGRDEYEGVGMGLAICKKIVEGHGGTITARSTLGQGSTFIVTLPVKRERQGPAVPDHLGSGAS